MSTPLPRLVDELRDHEQQARDAQKIVDEHKENARAIREEIIDRLKADGATAVGGATHTAQIVKSSVAQIADWPTFFKWAADHDADDIIQRRISAPAVRQRLEDGIEIDGIEQITIEKLSVRKNR